MRLTGDDRDVEISRPYEPFRFSGDESIECTLIAGPVRDFNAMFRRGAASGSIAVVRGSAAAVAPADFRLAYAAAGAHECVIAGRPPFVLEPGHAAVVGEVGECRSGAAGDRAARCGCRRTGRKRRMSMSLFAADALTSGGWMHDVRIEIAADGTIARVLPGAQPDGAERVAGPLLPGMPNLHSHAFQRAIAGRTGRASSEGDSFWTWRAAMYAFVDRIDADAVRGDRRAGVRRDAEGRIHGRRRVSLPAPRPAGQTLRRSGRDGAADRGGRGRGRDRAHAAAGLLRAWRLRRSAARPRPAPFPALAGGLRAPDRDSRAAMPRPPAGTSVLHRTACAR